MGQYALLEGWVSAGTSNEFALPFGWISEEEVVPDPTRTAVIAGAVPAPEGALAGQAQQVVAGGAVPFAAGLFDGWISETRAISAGLADGWIIESPQFVGVSAEIGAVVPAPSAALTATSWARVTLGGGPDPWSGMAATAMAWEIGQIFDDVPAPAVLVNVQTAATVGALIAGYPPGPVAAMTAFLTQYPILGAIDASTTPSAEVTALVLQSWPFADLRVDLTSPVTAMTATAQAGAAITAELPAPSGAMFADASYPTVGTLAGEVAAPVARMHASIWGQDVFPAGSAEFVLTVRPPSAAVLKPRRPPLGS